MCVTSLLCGPRADLWPFYVNGLNRFPYKSLYFECYATMPMLAHAHISSLGYLCFDQTPNFSCAKANAYVIRTYFASNLIEMKIVLPLSSVRQELKSASDESIQLVLIIWVGLKNSD